MLHRNIFLSLGSNSGDRSNRLSHAIDLIERQIGEVISKSRIYETAPWGKSDQPHFLNMALQIESRLSPEELLFNIQFIERTLGRARIEKWGERSIDIDIIYFGNEIINESNLIIPHPHLIERRFVLVPLTEINPEFVHPIMQKSNAQLLMDCKDNLTVKEFTG